MQTDIIALRSGFFVTRKLALLIFITSTILLISSSLISAFYAARITISPDSCQPSVNSKLIEAVPDSMIFSIKEIKLNLYNKFYKENTSLKISALNLISGNKIIKLLVPYLCTVFKASVFTQLEELRIEEQFLDDENQYYVIFLLHGLKSNTELIILVDYSQPVDFSNGIILMENQRK